MPSNVLEDYMHLTFNSSFHFFVSKVLEESVGYLQKSFDTLQWRHNGCDSITNHQPNDCLLRRLFRPRSKKTSKLRITGLCAGNSPGPVNSLHKWPVIRKMFPFDDVIMIWSNFSHITHNRHIIMCQIGHLIFVCIRCSDLDWVMACWCGSSADGCLATCPNNIKLYVIMYVSIQCDAFITQSIFSKILTGLWGQGMGCLLKVQSDLCSATVIAMLCVI